MVLRQYDRAFPGQRCHVSLAVEASSVVKADKQNKSTELGHEFPAIFTSFWDAHHSCPMMGRQKLVASIAPQLYGLFHVKLATLLMLIGGVPREDNSGSRIRGEVHMLLVGDPGTGGRRYSSVGLL